MPHDFIDDLIRQVKPFSFCDEARMKSLAARAESINARGVPGDFVECGSYKGGTSALLSRYMGVDRHLWVFDSFQGMPPTSDKDGVEAQKYVGLGGCSPDDVREVLRLAGTAEKDYTIRAGWFQDSLRPPLPSQVAFLHCDCDWYDSVTIVLNTFYPLIPPGGCIVLDDFGYWEGCREAFYDFCQRTGEKPLLERVGETQAYWFKGQTTCRPK